MDNYSFELSAIMMELSLTLTKVISLAGLFVLTVVFGILPYVVIVRQTRWFQWTGRRDRIMKFFNCFAGGVFLGALFLELMPEGAEQFELYKEAVGYDAEYPFFNLLIVFGFFITAIVEYFAHAILSPSSHQESCSPPQEPNLPPRVSLVVGNQAESSFLESNRVRGYGAVASNPSPLPVPGEPIRNVSVRNCSDKHNDMCDDFGNPVANQASRTSGDDSDVNYFGDRAGMRPTTPSNYFVAASRMRSALLLLALSFHSIFDGLALGLQETPSTVWQIFIAVSLHKCIVAFCLGLDLFINFSSTKIAALWMVTFSTISPIGVAIGIGVTSTGMNETVQLLSSSILQGIACGVFFYVTFLEILNSAWKHSHGHCKSLWDIVFALIGFGVMACAKIWHD